MTGICIHHSVEKKRLLVRRELLVAGLMLCVFVSF